MKSIILSLVFLVASNAQAASGSGNVSNIIQYGGANAFTGNMNVPVPSTATTITLWCASNSTSAGRFNPCSKNGTPYQVPVGKTFNVVRVCTSSGFANTGGSGFIQLVTATAAISTGAASLTGGVYQSGQSGEYTMTAKAAVFDMACIDGQFQMAASTYAGYQQSTTGWQQVTIFGYEQ